MPGTTTDPVEKPMELLPLGPVLFVDTAGVDDEGALGELRMARTRAVLDRVDLGVIVTDRGAWGELRGRAAGRAAGPQGARPGGAQQGRPGPAGRPAGPRLRTCPRWR